jgi:hypothetical protein
MKKAIVAIVLALGGCAGSALPPPNSVQARFDPRVGAVQVMVSEMQPIMQAELVRADGARVQAGSVTLVSAPHVDYSPPPSIGLGFGGFGFGSGDVGFGSGLGVGFPLGGPRPSHVSDQYVASISIPAPTDYLQRWNEYRVELRVGDRALAVAAPPPSAS